MARRFILVTFILMLALAAPLRAWASSPSPAQTAESLRSD
jgi:hypothetical protein